MVIRILLALCLLLARCLPSSLPCAWFLQTFRWSSPSLPYSAYAYQDVLLAANWLSSALRHAVCWTLAPALPPALFPCTRAVDGCQLQIRVLAEFLFTSDRSSLVSHKIPRALAPGQSAVIRHFSDVQRPCQVQMSITYLCVWVFPCPLRLAFHCKMQEYWCSICAVIPPPSYIWK